MASIVSLINFKPQKVDGSTYFFSLDLDDDYWKSKFPSQPIFNLKEVYAVSTSSP